MNRPPQLSLGLATSLRWCSAVARRSRCDPRAICPSRWSWRRPPRSAWSSRPRPRNYTHKESRASVDYEAQLGASHKHLVEEIFKAEFTDAKHVRQRRCGAPRARPAGHLRAAHRAVLVREREGDRRRVLRGDHPLPDRDLRAQRSSWSTRSRSPAMAADPRRRSATARKSWGSRLTRRCATRRRNSSRSSRRWMSPSHCWPRRRSSRRCRRCRDPPKPSAVAAEMTIETVPINDPPAVATTSTSSPAAGFCSGAGCRLSPAAPPAPSPPPSQMAAPENPATSL